MYFLLFTLFLAPSVHTYQHIGVKYSKSCLGTSIADPNFRVMYLRTSSDLNDRDIGGNIFTRALFTVSEVFGDTSALIRGGNAKDAAITTSQQGKSPKSISELAFKLRQDYDSIYWATGLIER